MFCGSCGHKVNQTQKFCSKCGAEVKASPDVEVSKKQNNTFAKTIKTLDKKYYLIGGSIFILLILIVIIISQVISTNSLNDKALAAKNSSQSEMSTYAGNNYSQLGNSPDNNQNGGYAVDAKNCFFVSDGNQILKYEGDTENNKLLSSKDVSASCLNFYNEKLYYYDTISKKVISVPSSDLSEENVVFECNVSAPSNSVQNICIYKDIINIITTNSGNTVIYQQKSNSNNWQKIFEQKGTPFCSQIDDRIFTVCITESSSYKIFTLDVCDPFKSVSQSASGQGAYKSVCLNDGFLYGLPSADSNKMICKNQSGNSNEVSIPFKASCLSLLGNTTVAWNNSGEVVWYNKKSNISHNLTEACSNDGAEIKSISSLRGHALIIYKDGQIKFVNPDKN